MLGISQYQTRTDLLAEKSGARDRSVSPETQVLFDNGHRFEATARPWAEELIGGELFPIIASMTVEGLPLSSSYDGTTMEEETIFEHKTLNQELAASLDRGVVPAQYLPQIEQQLLIIGAKKCLFMASNGDRTSMRHVWVESDPALRAKLIAAWRQFESDLKEYQHVETGPAPTGQAIMALPALTVQLSGEVKSSNLVVYRDSCVAFIKAINTNLQTDQDFADAEKTVKFCGEAEDRLEVVKAQALSQTASIDELFRTIDELSQTMRGKRLELEKLVKARKDAIRDEIRRGGANALADHVGTLINRIGKPYMPVIQADFAGVMKGKKTIASLRDAVDTELARAKIEANAIADRIDINLKSLGAEGAAYAFLFSDMAQICLKANDDFAALVKLRIAEHKAAEERRLEQERERIRQEETAKLAPKPVAPQPAPHPVKPMFAPSVRPADEEMIAVLAAHYNTTADVVTKWLGEMNLKRIIAAKAA
jgi:predicted phage-related endonuclease